MAPKPRSYYRDNTSSNVDSLAVIETGDEGVRVIENRDRGWCAPFWMPEQEFHTYTHGDDVTRVGLLPDEKLAEVLEVAA